MSCLTQQKDHHYKRLMPGKVVLCMYGKVTENNGGEACSFAEKYFFGINPIKTREKRKDIKSLVAVIRWVTKL